MEQDILPFLVVLAAIFAAVLALAALFVPSEATAPAASVEGSAGHGTDTHAAAGPNVGDGTPVYGSERVIVRPAVRRVARCLPPAAGGDLGAIDGPAQALPPEPPTTSPMAGGLTGSSFTALPRR